MAGRSIVIGMAVSVGLDYDLEGRKTINFGGIGNCSNVTDSATTVQTDQG